MPMYAFECLNGHKRDAFAHNVLERACRTVICDCGEGMAPVMSLGRGLTFFAEKGGGRLIHNLGPEPILITSTAQHERLMKEQGVTWAPPRRGMPGQWV